MAKRGKIAARIPRNRLAARIALVSTAVLLFLGTITFYANRVIFDSGRFATRATSALQDDSVKTLVGQRVAEQVATAVPDSAAVQPLIEAVASTIVGSSPFQALFRRAAYDFHGALLHANRSAITLVVADAGLLISNALTKLQPKLAAQIPKGVTAKLLSLSNGFPQLTLVDLGRLSDYSYIAAPVLLLLAVLAVGLAFLFAPLRRSALRHLGIALITVGLILAVGYEVARIIVQSQFAVDWRSAVGSVWGAFFGDLRAWGLAMAAAGAVITAFGESLLRPGELHSLTHRIWRFFVSPPPTLRLRIVRAVLLMGIGLAAIFSYSTVLEIALFFGGTYLIFIGSRELMRLTVALYRDVPALEDELVTRLQRVRNSRLVRASAVSSVGVLAIGSVALTVFLTQASSQPPLKITACNGFAQLCDKPISEVVFPATHNSMSALHQPGWLFPNQSNSIPNQLNAGIRGLLIDTHYGIPTPRGVASLLAPGSKSRLKFSEQVNEAFVMAAERLRSHLGYKGGGKPEVYFCHGYCELGATPAITGFRNIRDFLIANPYEVLLISIEDDTSPADTTKVIKASGLLEFVYKGPLGPGNFPTLRELITMNQRVIIMSENHTNKRFPWYRAQFELFQETPYEFKSVTALQGPKSCVANRGGSKPPLFLVNNWVDSTPAPRQSNAKIVNSYDRLLNRVRLCERIRKRVPNLIAVDFYLQGDLLKVANTLNGVG